MTPTINLGGITTLNFGWTSPLCYLRYLLFNCIVPARGGELALALNQALKLFSWLPWEGRRVFQIATSSNVGLIGRANAWPELCFVHQCEESCLQSGRAQRGFHQRNLGSVGSKVATRLRGSPGDNHGGFNRGIGRIDAVSPGSLTWAEVKNSKLQDSKFRENSNSKLRDPFF